MKKEIRALPPGIVCQFARNHGIPLSVADHCKSKGCFRFYGGLERKDVACQRTLIFKTCFSAIKILSLRLQILNLDFMNLGVLFLFDSLFALSGFSEMDNRLPSLIRPSHDRHSCLRAKLQIRFHDKCRWVGNLDRREFG